MKKFLVLSLTLVLLSSAFAFVYVQGAHAQQHTQYTQHTQSGIQVPFTQEDEVGYWQTPGCDSTSLIGVNSGHAFFRRFYVISLTGAVVRYSFYYDSACQQPLYTLRLFAWSTLGKVLTTIPHTRAMHVVFDAAFLTAESRQGQQFLSSCGASSWNIGQEHNITVTGCRATYPDADLVGEKGFTTGVSRIKREECHHFQ